MENTERGASVSPSLRVLRVAISIGGLGIGCSALGSSHRLPFVTLEIDRSFAGAMERDGDGNVRTLLDLARSPKPGGAAEGTETAALVEARAALGCDGAQGFHLPYRFHSIASQRGNGLRSGAARADDPRPVCSAGSRIASGAGSGPCGADRRVTVSGRPRGGAPGR